MGVSRSGYYKWKKREKSDRDVKREEMIALVDAVHEKHRSHGYRWTAAYTRLEYGYNCSDNYIYKDVNKDGALLMRPFYLFPFLI